MTDKEALKFAKEQTYIFGGTMKEFLQFVIDKLERPQGEWVRKEDVIHSIAKQYSEHNELVPIWLSIGDMKGGADNDK